MPEDLKVPVEIGERSWIGIDITREPPYPCGNYFGIIVKDLGPVRILNMWAENLEALDERVLEDHRVWIKVWSYNDHHWGLINDGRIGPEWHNKKLCWIGTRQPPLAIAQEIYAVFGDPTNEVEQFSDPVSYWSKRGARFENGLVIMEVKPA